jgi:uncharacterized RDD family membrane protein YckC
MMELVGASKGERAAAYIIDVIPAALAGLMFGWIPFVGAMIAGFILAPYWLLRDITGASIGKLVLGLRVVAKDNQEASIGKRVLRNLPLAIGPALLVIPIVGYIVAPFVALPISLVEIILLFSQGERLGDKLAGTSVVYRAKASSGIAV